MGKRWYCVDPGHKGKKRLDDKKHKHKFSTDNPNPAWDLSAEMRKRYAAKQCSTCRARRFHIGIPPAHRVPVAVSFAPAALIGPAVPAAVADITPASSPARAAPSPAPIATGCFSFLGNEKGRTSAEARRAEVGQEKETRRAQTATAASRGKRRERGSRRRGPAEIGSRGVPPLPPGQPPALAQCYHTHYRVVRSVSLRLTSFTTTVRSVTKFTVSVSVTECMIERVRNTPSVFGSNQHVSYAS